MTGDAFSKSVEWMRNRDSRVYTIDSATQSDTLKTRSMQTSVAPSDGNGYWEGGEWKEFFRLGVSKFGDGSVLG